MFYLLLETNFSKLYLIYLFNFLEDGYMDLCFSCCVEEREWWLAVKRTWCRVGFLVKSSGQRSPNSRSEFL